jgi:hypothetical protein
VRDPKVLTPLFYVSKPIGRSVRVQPAIRSNAVNDDGGVPKNAEEKLDVLGVETVDVIVDKRLDFSRGFARHRHPSGRASRRVGAEKKLPFAGHLRPAPRKWRPRAQFPERGAKPLPQARGQTARPGEGCGEALLSFFASSSRVNSQNGEQRKARRVHAVVNGPLLQFVIGNNGPLRETPFRLSIAARRPRHKGDASGPSRLSNSKFAPFVTMIAISITAEAYRAIRAEAADVWPPHPFPGSDGLIRIWLDRATFDRLGTRREPGESYSNVILKLAEASP